MRYLNHHYIVCNCRFIQHNTMRNLETTIQLFINFGYVITFKDGERYIELYKDFNNSGIEIDGINELQIGRFIEIWDNNIISKTYMKRGWLWSGSAYVPKNKGNVFAIGTERLIAKI